MSQFKTIVGDTASLGALVAVFLDKLPVIALLATTIWAVLRVYEIILTIQIKRLEKQTMERNLGDV